MRRLLVVVTLVCLAGAGVARSGVSEEANQQQADQDTTAALALLQLPPGAERSDTNPAANPSLIDSPNGAPATPNLVIRSEFWRVPGQPTAAIAWFKAHPPAGSRIVTEGSGGKLGAPLVWWVGFGRRKIANVLSQRQTSVTATAADGGGTALRVDAIDVWMIPRPESERVPFGSRTLEVVVRDAQHALVKRVVTHEPMRIAAVVRLLNRLPLVQPGVVFCPLDRGFQTVLTFRSADSGPPQARAVAGIGGCSTVRLTLAGQRQPTLSAFDLIADIEASLGVTISLPGPQEAPFPVARVASGQMPGGEPFELVAYRDPRTGVCTFLFASGVMQSQGCLTHPRGKRSSYLTALSCYPRAVTAFAVLGGADATGATAVFDDDLRVPASEYRLPTTSVQTRIGVVGGRIVRLKRPVKVDLGYRGPFYVGFRRGAHDFERIDVAGRSPQRFWFGFGLFLEC